MPLSPGKARAARSATSASARSAVAMQPPWAPRSRRMRVSLRVSMPAIATVSPSTRNSDSEWLARQLEWSNGRSRITRPAACTESDSRSSGVTPVLPMCGQVSVTIWRA
jgi:hypothetical protein